MSYTLIKEHQGDSITWDSDAQTFRVRFSRGESESPVDVTFRAGEVNAIAAFHAKVGLLEE